MTLVELLENSSRIYPKKVALIFGEKRIIYAELNNRVIRVSYGLIQLGINKDEKIAILLKNCLEYVISYFAILKIGAIVIPLNFMLKEEELKYILGDAGVSTVITSSEFIPTIDRLKLRLENLRQVIVVGEKIPGTINFSDLLSGSSGCERALDFGPENVATILYTSGTTGHPKGVMLTHRNLISNVSASIKAIRLTKKDRFLCFLPMFHSFTWTVCVLVPLYIGAIIVIMESVRPFGKVVRNIIRNRVTIFVGIPPIYNVISNIPVPRILVSRLLKILNPLRICISGAASLPVEVLEKFEKKFHIPLLEGYGLTEASPVVSISPLEKRKPGSVGLPLPDVEVKVVDEDGNQLPPNKEGELLVKGDNVMQGYYKLPEETEKTIKGDWLYTGDIVKIDREGYIYIVDRKKDMIIVRGLNVYPREIEEVLYQNPKIAEAAVIGIKDKLRGEVPIAYVALKKDEKTTEGEIIRFLRERLASYKVPRAIEFRDSLPKTSTGKILKRALRSVKGT